MDDPTLLSWIERGQNVAALLVAIGVAAEFLLGFMAGPARNRVSQAKDNEIIRLQTKLDFQGPRAPFIENAAPELIKTLLPFAGQKVALYVCTSAELRTQEGEM